MGTKQIGTRPGPIVEIEGTRIPAPARESLGWRVRVTTLWIALTVGMVAATVLALVEPGILEDVMAGEVEGEKITDSFTLMFAAFFLVPLVMAFLTLVLPNTANRWANGIIAAVLTVMNAMDIAGHVSDGSFGGEALMMVGVIVAGLAIVWYAWRGRVGVRGP